MKKSTVNSESEMICVRVKIPKVEHLRKKAFDNPNNPHNHVATEVNRLIDSDFDKSQMKVKVHGKK